ncbi:MAG: mechanosensitive ion channel family protein [Rubrivivax sp.]
MAQAQNASAPSAVADKPQQIDVDIGTLWEKLDSWIDGAVRLLPNVLVGLVVLAIFYGLGVLAARLIRKTAQHRSRDNLGEVLGGFIKWVLIVLGLLFAATIVLPTLKPGDLIAGLGVSSVAIGFAFKDILQNWLAGLLLLLRQPFQVDDQIEVDGHEGTVVRIETRATIIKTYDGQRIIIPNSNIYTSALKVKTAHEQRRSQYDVGIGYGDGIAHAREVIVAAIASVPEAQKQPPPEALVWDLSASWVTIRARWWTDSRRSDVVRVRAQVLEAIKNGLDEAGIDMPYDTQVQLFHDQTEDHDGVRGEQREGWPSGGKKPPKTRWQARAEQAGKAAPDAPEKSAADGHQQARTEPGRQ